MSEVETKEEYDGQEMIPTEQTTKRQSGKKILLIGCLCLFLIAGVTAFFFFENSRVYKECYSEAGVEVSAQDFLKNPDESAYFTEDSDLYDITVPGEYQVRIKTGLFSHRSSLYISDTIAPQGEPVKVNLEMGEECEADAFVSDIIDATLVEVSYVEQPDFTIPGKQSIEVVLTDLGGNRLTLVSELFISQVVSELTVEAGSNPPELKDFVIEGETAKFTTNINSFDYTVPADKIVKLQVDDIDYEVTMHIVDTVAPTLEVQDVSSFTLLPIEVEKFIISVDDVTEVKADFVENPDLTQVGEQTVEIRVTDAGGNAAVKSVKLTLDEDVEAPVISGVTDLSVLAGGSVSYKKNVTVTDNCPEGLNLIVDNSAVNLNVEGTYPITYIARDFAGNETTAMANITVRPKVYDENEVYALADSVLARIITPDMTPEQKLEAIYSYNQSHIAYISHSEKGNWVRAAYEGLAEGRGDCYVYACTAKVLLTRAGITNMDIEKIPSRTSHYWNLVNLGYGWYHFDTTPRSSGHPHICMWTEAQLMEYSTAHYNSHNYDHSLYPEVN